MFLPPISHHALGTSSCHCCVLLMPWEPPRVILVFLSLIGQSVIEGRTMSDSTIGATRPPTPTFGGQRPASIRPLTAAYQAASASHQVGAPLSSPLPLPSPPPILLRHFNLCLSLRLCRPIPILHRKAPVYFQRRLNTYLDGEDCIPSISSSCLSVSVCYVPPCTLAVTCFCPLREEDEINSICTLNMIYQYCCKYIVFLEMTLYL